MLSVSCAVVLRARNRDPLLVPFVYDLFLPCVPFWCNGGDKKGYPDGQKSAQMLRDICGWLNINSMKAEKVRYHGSDHASVLSL